MSECVCGMCSSSSDMNLNLDKGSIEDGVVEPINIINISANQLA